VQSSKGAPLPDGSAAVQSLCCAQDAAASRASHSAYTC
jgi:hypothetical protein